MPSPVYVTLKILLHLHCMSYAEYTVHTQPSSPPLNWGGNEPSKSTRGRRTSLYLLLQLISTAFSAQWLRSLVSLQLMLLNLLFHLLSAQHGLCLGTALSPQNNRFKVLQEAVFLLLFFCYKSTKWWVIKALDRVSLFFSWHEDMRRGL